LQINTIFIGNESPFLKVIRQSSNLQAVVCEQITGRKAKKYFGSAYDFAVQKNIPVIKTEIFLKHPASTDLIIVFGCSELMPPNVISSPKKGIVNIHQSLLPAYRGRHPLNWTIINGEKYSGITIHHINKKFDDGKIILQKKLSIKDDDTIMDLYKKTITAGNILLKQLFDILETEKFSGYEQERSHATYFRPRKPKDGKINWNHSAKQIRNLIRALVEPYPGAYFYHCGKKIILEQAEIVKKDDTFPDHVVGKPFFYHNNWYIKTGDHFLKLIKIRHKKSFSLFHEKGESQTLKEKLYVCT